MFNRQNYWLLADGIQPPLTPQTRPVRTEPVSLSAPGTTALDQAHTHFILGVNCKMEAKGTRILLMEGKVSPTPHPFAISRPEPKTLTDWHTSRDQHCLFKCIWKQQQFYEWTLQSEGLETTVTDDGWIHTLCLQVTEAAHHVFLPLRLKLIACGQLCLTLFC